MSAAPARAPRVRRWLAAALTALVVLGAAPRPLPAADDAATRREKLAELKQLRERIQALQARLDRVRTHRDAVRAELRTAEVRIASQTRDLERLAGEIADHRTQLARLRAERARYEERLGVQRKLLAQQVRAAYAIGRQEYLKMLLNQEEPAAVGRVLRYYDYFHRARSQAIDAARTTLAHIAGLEQRIGEQTAALEDKQRRQKQDKAALEEAQAERTRVVARLSRDLNDKGAELARLQGDEKRLQDLVEALKNALSDIPPEAGNRRPFPQLRGKLPWPVAGRVEPLFGKPRGAGGITWKGVRIDANEGREVHAVSHGRVAFADWLRGYGMLIIIDHGDGYMSLYGHNQTLYKETGDWVEAGERIAAVGRSGGQEHAALYFEIRHNGRPTNPERWCHG